MAIAKITKEAYDVSFGNDDIVFPSVLEERPGGMTVLLGTASGYTYPLDFIPAGAVIVRNTTTNEFALLDVAVTDQNPPAYIDLPTGWAYEGLVRASKSVEEPFVSSVYAGTANDAAMVIPITTAMKTAISAALPKITFKKN
jgi:hypothetical protein